MVAESGRDDLLGETEEAGHSVQSRVQVALHKALVPVSTAARLLGRSAAQGDGSRSLLPHSSVGSLHARLGLPQENCLFVTSYTVEILTRTLGFH